MYKYQASSTLLWHHVIILIQTSEHIQTRKIVPKKYFICLIHLYFSNPENSYIDIVAETIHFESLASEEVASFK